MAAFAKWTLLRRQADDENNDDVNWEFVSDGHTIPWWYSDVSRRPNVLHMLCGVGC